MHSLCFAHFVICLRRIHVLIYSLFSCWVSSGFHGGFFCCRCRFRVRHVLSSNAKIPKILRTTRRQSLSTCCCLLSFSLLDYSILGTEFLSQRRKKMPPVCLLQCALFGVFFFFFFSCFLLCSACVCLFVFCFCFFVCSKVNELMYVCT